MDIKGVIQNYYEGLAEKTDEWQRDLSNDVVFSDASGVLNAKGKEAFIQSFSTFLRSVQNVTLKQLIVESSAACAVVGYDYVSPTGEKMHQDDAEVWKVENGKITSLTIYFDITAFRKFMGR